MFKTIPAYPNYEVSEQGQVRNKTTGHNMKWVDNGKGYKVVKLYNAERPQGRLCLVHRLVLSTFDPKEGLDVNHKDGDKSNNTLPNLEWVTKSQNTQHAHKTGLFKNKLTIEEVQQIKECLKAGYGTYSKIGRMYGVRHSTIWKIANGVLYDYV